MTSTAGGGSNTAGYGYDEMGRLKEVKDNGTLLATFGYDLNGNRRNVYRANGVTSTYQYDSLNRLDTLTHAKGAAVLSSFNYTVRGDGKRTGLSESVVNADAGRVSNRSATYEFDESGRLTGEQSRDGRGVAYENLWRYDAAGNRAGETHKSATLAAPSTFSSVTTTVASFNENDWLTRQTRTTQTVGVADTTSQSDWSYDDKELRRQPEGYAF